MSYDIQRAIEFWYQFDDFFNGRFKHVPNDILQAYKYETRLLGLWIQDRVNGTYPQGFINSFNDDIQFKEAIRLMASNQIRIMNDNFQGDGETEQRSFEDFGQGILYDNRRTNGQKIHTMDEGYGYQRWHAFIRAAVFIGEDSERWLQIDRNVGLAWAIESTLHPRQDHDGENPSNPARQDIVDELRPTWLSCGVEELDKAFDTVELRKAFGFN